MDLSKLALLRKIEQCLISVRRQQRIVSLFKSTIVGILVSALVIALYIVFWPNVHYKMAALSAVFGNGSLVWPFTILLIFTAIWLVLGILLSLICFSYLRYRHNKLSKSVSATAAKPENFLLHLNRLHPSLEESAHLLMCVDNSLSAAQIMQLKRITPALAHIINSPDHNWLPKAPYVSLIRKNCYVLLLGLLLLIGAITITTSKQHPVLNTTSTQTPQSAKPNTNYLSEIEVVVRPPEYTQQPQYEQNFLNIEALQGSEITWFIPLDKTAQKSDTFALTLSDTQTLPFVSNALGYSLSLKANLGAVYTITQSTSTGVYISDIATLSVLADTSPKITFKTPILTITEINKNDITSIPTIVNVQDDYGITNVTIVASIAKGSGEAVKFRDQEFLFDSEKLSPAQTIGVAKLYTKTWDLRALNMAPGDELYFSVHASDNKTPNTQTSVSPIKIIRWLEDEEDSVSGEGIIIDFMPEYFKSQRQIIIETQALIEQSTLLSKAEYNAVSRALAIDQSDLKQSYGQYLGDENESGLMHNMEAGAVVTSPPEHTSGDTDEHSENDQLEQSHEHESQSDHSESGGDLSGYQEVIEQFGHNHGEANIGFIKTTQGQINPKVLMKRAISAMWQAELHLQLSEPALALPYEKVALNFLNRAKQAERIYVKRLGFEPPPVTEERRYTGKLKDILSYERDTKTLLEPDQNSEFVALIVLLNKHLTLDKSTLNPLSPEQRLLMDSITRYLTGKLASEPKWINQLATLKRIQIANSFDLKNCVNCLTSLLTELSTQLLPPIAQPFTKTETYSANHPAVKAYSKSLLNMPTNNKTQPTQGSKP